MAEGERDGVSGRFTGEVGPILRLHELRPRGCWPGRVRRAMFAAGSRTEFTGQLTFLPLRSEEHTSELQSRENLVCRLLLEKKKKKKKIKKEKKKKNKE